jgi:hypothetical protein
MSPFEHAMLAVNGCLATRLQEKWGWSIAAVAGVSALTPDWDGLTLLGSGALFAQAHRVWGHNLMAAASIGVLLGLIDYRFDVLGHCGRRLRRWLPDPPRPVQWRVEQHRSVRGYLLWSIVAAAAALSHLAGDLLFSGGMGLADWELQLAWPFSPRGWVYPMVPWGDVGVTLVFSAGMFAMLRRPAGVTQVARVTLIAVALYVLVRGFCFA